MVTDGLPVRALAVPTLLTMALLAPGAPAAFDNSAYAALLKAHVNEEGRVNYRALKADPARLDAYLRQIASVSPTAFAGWSDKQKIAFWINAYNACTLKAIIDHYPIEGPRFSRFPQSSIRQVPGAWDRLKFTVLGQPMTLDAIEHKTLRRNFAEPRIHVALVCAAKSCPRLRGEPYTAEKLDAQFEDQARDFLKDPNRFAINREGGTVYLSAIFKWFAKDFSPKYDARQGFGRHGDELRAVLSYVAAHLDEKDAAYLRRGSYKVKYLKYDWSLNEQTPEADALGPPGQTPSPPVTGARRVLRDALLAAEGLGAWGPFAVALIYIPACVLFLPGSVLTLGAGALFGLVKETIAVSIGSTLGAALAFILGRTVARRWIEKRVASHPSFAAIDEAVGREGFKIVFLTRLSPVFPFNLLNYAYGLTRVKFRHYFLASWIGMLPGTIMYVYIGSALGSVAAIFSSGGRTKSTAEWVLYGVGLVATIVVTVFVTRVARRALKNAAPGTSDSQTAEEERMQPEPNP